MKVPMMIAVALLMVGCRRPTPSSPFLGVSDFAGEWVVQDYIREVQRTRTPHQAWSSKPWTLSFSIVRTNQGPDYEFNSTTFHEAGLLGPILRLQPTQQPSEFRMVLADQNESVILRIESGDKRPIAAVRAIDSSGNSELFLRLPGTLAHYMNRLILAGDYEDSSGSKYSFSESAEAQWPDRRFGYEISLAPREAGG